MDFTESAKKVLAIAVDEANALSHTYVGTEHILLGLIKEKDGLAAKLLRANGIEEKTVKKMIEENIEQGGDILTIEPNGYSPSSKRVLERAKTEAKNLNQDEAGTEHILIAIMKDSDCLAIRILNTIKGTNLKKMYIDLMSIIGVSDKNAKVAGYEAPSDTPVLDNFSRDLTSLARQDLIDPVVGRENEINRVIQILSRRTKNNPCLIGEPGVGKTSIAEGLALLVVKKNVPDIMKDKRIVTLDVGSLVAGTKYRGEFEERIKRILEELKNTKNVVLFIDEIHTIIGAGGAEGSLDAANILKPALARGEIQVIGATTIEEYRKHIEKDAALERRFQTVMVSEPTVEECIEILKGLRSKYEDFHSLIISDEAIEEAVKLSTRYIPDRKLPDKAIDLIDEACSKIKINSFVKPKDIESLEEEIKKLEAEKEEYIKKEKFDEARAIKEEQNVKKLELEKKKKEIFKNNTQNKLTVRPEDICDVVAEWTKIPVSKISED
ncbi:MAG: ATP-dependent Clp protease ATP-binding subunit, partial [Lachnospiraceae bacterium]|nr:ATP-dependent Clp protease ATP-binding subunit [Lachnospiraceae bacterium]